LSLDDINNKADEVLEEKVAVEVKKVPQTPSEIKEAKKLKAAKKRVSLL
jgi:hypothetical protein